MRLIPLVLPEEALPLLVAVGWALLLFVAQAQ